MRSPTSDGGEMRSPTLTSPQSGSRGRKGKVSDLLSPSDAMDVMH